MISFKVEKLTEINAALQDFINYLQSDGMTEDEVFDCKLVSCELLTNVIRHLGETARFDGDVLPDSIVITVSSDSGYTVPPLLKLPDVFAESGRGLYIINSICGGDIFTVDGGICVRIKRKSK